MGPDSIKHIMENKIVESAPISMTPCLFSQRAAIFLRLVNAGVSSYLLPFIVMPDCRRLSLFLSKNGGIRLCLILKPDSLLQAAGTKGKNWPRR